MSEAGRKPPTRGGLGAYAKWLPVAIAVISILGSFVSWRAASTSSRAAELQASAQRLDLQHAQRDGEVSAWIEHDRRLFDRYAEDVAESNRHLRDARRRGGTVQGDVSSFQAESHYAQARLFRTFFIAGLPAEPSNGRTDYDAAYFEAYWNDVDLELASLALARDAARDDAEAAHDRTTWLLGVVAVLILSLFFLTVARFTDEWVRVVVASAGLAIALIGLTTFVALEVFA